jgi:hypothetical protein
MKTMYYIETVAYTGVGSRAVPGELGQLMFAVARTCAHLGLVLRSGGAEGSDRAFEHGCDAGGGQKEIWKAKDATAEAIEIAGRFHGAWHLCTPYVRQLHGRNVFQVLGRDLQHPSAFLICWTPDGCRRHEDRTIATGGTGTAISVASSYGVPVYNLKLEQDLERVRAWLASGCLEQL